MQFPVLNVIKSRKNGISEVLALIVQIATRIFTRTFIQTKYYPESNCRVCHNENRWSDGLILTIQRPDSVLQECMQDRSAEHVISDLITPE